MPLAAAILLSDPDVLDLPPPAMVREVFNLTPAEADIALAVGGGQTLKEIAQQRGCSVNTVRTLVGRAFTKTGCRRQSELVRVISTLNDIRAAGAGLASGMALAAPAYQHAFHRGATSQLRALLELPLQAPPNQRATVIARGFGPGESTGSHVHGCGHEIVCVLDGSLTLEYASHAPTRTVAGEAVYVPPGVAHCGLNTSATSGMSLLHVGIGPGGSIDRRNL